MYGHHDTGLPQATGDDGISLRGKLDDANGALRSAHEALNDLEDRLLGPSPRPIEVGQSASSLPVAHPGASHVATQVVDSANNLGARIAKLGSAV